MKRFVVILFACLNLLVGARAQEMRRPTSAQEKFFRINELQRYRSLFTQVSEAVQSGAGIDVKYYNLNVAITTSPQYLKGKMLMTASSVQDNLATVTLDLMSSMTVDSVKAGGALTTFVQHASTFDITLDHSYNTGDVLTVEVFYQGRPGSSGFGSFEFSSHSSTPWVWSLSEPYGAKDWWPCKDHPIDKADSADITVTCDSTFKVGSNGKLVSVTNNGDGTKTHHWQERYPISTYLISVALTNFAQYSNWFKYSPTDSMEVLNYVLPENLSQAISGTPSTVEGLQVFSDLFGLYPFINEKYGHSQFGWGGAMEHQTMTTTCCFDEWILIHELSHQWFGDMITCRTWPDIWLNEGFATYCEALFVERKYGSSWYWSYINGDMYGAKSAVGTVYVQDSANVGTLFDGNLVYSKGATVLHMLRHVLGDSVFFRVMNTYANTPSLRYATASTTDFETVCETVSGKDLHYFFNEWIYGQNYPRYAYEWSSAPSGSGFSVTFWVGQSTGTTNPSFFTMPVDIRIISGGWDTTVTIWNNAGTQTFTIPVSHNPTSVQLDPDGWILKDFTPLVALSPSTINFGGVVIGNSKIDSVAVMNAGSGTLVVPSANSDFGDFVVSPTNAIILPLQSQEFYIRYTPSSLGPASGHVLFTTNSSGTAAQAGLSGTGFTPTFSFSVSRRWNIVSLPLTVADPRKSMIFSTALSNAMAYVSNSGYAPVDSLRNGVGYWLKFGDDQDIPITGLQRNVDTVFVNPGWNLIGATSSPLPIGSIIETPSHNITSRFFGYKNGYFFSDTLQPARGYWVKAKLSGMLLLQSLSNFKCQSVVTDELQQLNHLVVQDPEGNQQSLYFGSASDIMQSEMHGLPPIAPGATLDARFASGRFVELTKAADMEIPILVTAESYPLSIHADFRSTSLSVSLTVQGEEIFLADKQTVQIVPSESRTTVKTGTLIVILKVSGKPQSPQQYALEQNFPNPFNPVTIIRYDLPVDSYVKLRVCNVLGQEVRSLVNAFQEAGIKSVSFDAGNLPSGMYFYDLSAGRYTAVKKMILSK